MDEWSDAKLDALIAEATADADDDGVRQAVGLSELPLPSPPPEGAEWAAAYRRWAGR